MVQTLDYRPQTSDWKGEICDPDSKTIDLRHQTDAKMARDYTKIMEIWHDGAGGTNNSDENIRYRKQQKRGGHACTPNLTPAFRYRAQTR